MPVSRKVCSAAAGSRSILTPSASNMSAAPLLEDMERLPCLATATPAAATTKDTAVEMLSVPSPSPPVPQRSIAMGGAAMAFIWARIAVTAPTNSDVTGFRAESASRKFLISSSSARPLSNSPKICAASSAVRGCCATRLGSNMSLIA